MKKANWYPVIAISIIGGAIFIAMMITTIVECNRPMEAPNNVDMYYRFDMTDSGMYFNERDIKTKEIIRIFGPVEIYTYENNIDTTRIMDSLKLWYKETVLHVPKDGTSSD